MSRSGGPGTRPARRASAHRLTCWYHDRRDTGIMLRTVNWVTRALGFAWLGLLAFLLAPPHGTAATLVQAAGYCLLGLALVAMALMEAHPVAARYHDRALTVIRGVITVATGFAAG